MLTAPQIIRCAQEASTQAAEGDRARHFIAGLTGIIEANAIIKGSASNIRRMDYQGAIAALHNAFPHLADTPVRKP